MNPSRGCCDGIGAALVGEAGGTLLLDDSTTVFDTIAEIERDVGPRWVWWNRDTATALVGHGIRPARCSDLDVVHRLLVGGWRAGPGRVWAAHRGLDPRRLPVGRHPICSRHPTTTIRSDPTAT